MKSIKEKEQLIKMSLALGMEPDAKIVKEVLEYKQMMADVKKKSASIVDVFEEIASIKEEQPVQQTLIIPKPPSLDEITFLFEEEVKEEPKAILEVPKPPTVDELLEQFGTVENKEPIKEEPKNSLIDLAASHITKEVMNEQRAAATFEQPEVALPQSVSELKRKVKMLEEWITKISMTGPGSGEVNLLRLDDVDTANIANERYLRYNSNTAKIEFATITGGGGGGGEVDLGNVNSNIVPTLDSTFNLGSADKRFKTLFLANNTIDLGGSLIQSDGTGQISISGTGAVLPSGSRIDVGAVQQKIALVGDTGVVINVVPFYTQARGLNTIAANFEFGYNPDDFTFTSFTLSNGTSLTRAGTAQFYF